MNSTLPVQRAGSAGADPASLQLYRRLRRACLCLIGLSLAGCSSLGYYSQAIGGHLELLERRQPIPDLLADPDTPAELRARLEQALALRTFASEELGLPDNASYRGYADLERDFVVWNVVATPPLSLQPREWCFLLVGCLQYRGYYREAEARAFAAGRAARGDDVYVGGASAYSTLGWFADPVLNTMLRGDDHGLARIMFHELAHQQLFIDNDTAFNEAFAEAVAIAGVRRWLQDQPQALAEFEQRVDREQQLMDRIMVTRRKLRELYASSAPKVTRHSRKAAILAELEQDYHHLRQTEWQDYAAFDGWFAGGLNNAKLAAVATYRRLLPDFRHLLEALDGDLPRFYRQVAALEACQPAARRHWLETLQPVNGCRVPRPDRPRADTGGY